MEMESSENTADQIYVSVIIITYNHERYISKALDSVLSQVTNFKYEILIGDDASNDRTPDILKKYEEKEVEDLFIYYRKDNLNATRNIYDLYKRAKGKYIANLEGDDYWNSVEKLQLQINFLEKNNYIACTHDCLLVDVDGRKLENQNIEWICSKTVFQLEDSKGFYLSGQMATLVFRNIFKDSTDEDKYSIIWRAHPIISDRVIQFILASQGDIYHMDKNMSCYRVNLSKNASNATNKEFANNVNSPYENILITKQLQNYIKVHQINKDIKFGETELRFYVSSVIRFIKKPSIQSLSVLMKIMAEFNFRGVIYFFLTPIELAKLAYSRRIKEKMRWRKK